MLGFFFFFFQVKANYKACITEKIIVNDPALFDFRMDMHKNNVLSLACKLQSTKPVLWDNGSTNTLQAKTESFLLILIYLNLNCSETLSHSIFTRLMQCISDITNIFSCGVVNIK